ncbi:class I SAM-dependent methyltransferase [Streptomyces sp. 6N223]|uniref:class I SAM-dependent methyltransferase n=1 Tax=Streptomyces sp. 6N223 TaxID=3457412 RepID=UPI003FCFFCF3
MHTAPDGSPVALYRRLPERSDDAALLHRLLPEGGSVLDLGCGTGRLAEPLARLGHPVTGVDNEPEMLAHLRSATPVCADIAALDLGGERFDAVLLMSHLINVADEAFVAAALRTARRHLRDEGLVVAERYPPGWVATCAESSRERDGVRFTLTGVQRRDGVLTATVRYEFDGLAADQRFSARDAGDERLDELAGAAGLRLDSALNPAGTLTLLRPRTSAR